MGVPINNVTRRVVFAASGTGPYAFTFEILAATDISVYRDDTLLTLTTNYTVTINANGTGSVTLTAAPTGATQIAIVGNRSIQRTTDFVTGGDFFANTLNDELDQQTIFAQQNAEGLARALQAPQTDPTTINMILPRATVRANKTLAFDATGNPIIGDSIGNWRGNWAASTAYALRDIVKDASNSNVYICLTAHTSTGTTPISSNADSAKWAIIVDAAAAGTSATAAASSATSAASSATLANDWATKTSSAVAGGEFSAKYHAQAAATSASNAATSATNAASSASTASSAASSVTSGVTTASEWATKTTGQVASTDYSAKAYAIGGTGVDGSIGSAKDWASKASGTVNGTDYSAKYHATAAATSATSASSSASSATSSASSATSSASSATASASTATTQAGIATTQASNASSSASSASTSASTATTQAGIATTKAGEAASSATSAATAKTAAEAAYDSFDDRYLGAKSSAPTLDNDGNALLTGAIYWNTTGNQLYVWTGSAWNAAAFTASGGVVQTSSTGSAVIPSGTDAQRDGSPSVGYFRFNTDSDSFEGYDGTAWGAIGGGGATTLTVTNRSGSGVSVPLTNGFLPVTNRAGSTVNVSVS